MKDLIDGEKLYAGIISYKNAIKDCESIISQACCEFEWKDAKVGSFEGERVEKEIRKNLSMDLDPSYRNDICWFSLAQLIWSYGDSYAKHHNIEFSNMETPQMLKYQEKKDYYISHVDSSSSHPRIFSCIVYLNDVELGGETYFDKIDLSIKPERGKLVIFPADYVYSHEARSPEKGEKFVIVTWFRP